jgi:hypothetical protein
VERGTLDGDAQQRSQPVALPRFDPAAIPGEPVEMSGIEAASAAWNR